MNNEEVQGKDKNLDCPQLLGEQGPVLCLVCVLCLSSHLWDLWHSI